MPNILEKKSDSRFPANDVASSQDAVNRRVYHSDRVYRFYLSNVLTPPEAAALLKYQGHIAGRDILEIGVGAGRTARYLAPIAGHYEAIDYSPVMVRYMNQTMPQLSVREADFRNLQIFGDNSFDFVFAPDNVIDALPHQDRMQALMESYRLLRPGGLLVFSSHNVRYRGAFSGPRLNWSSNPLRLAANFVNYFRGCWNHLRVGPLRQDLGSYALLNDEGHHYACLHYYAARTIVTDQLKKVGFRSLDVFNNEGQIALAGHDDSHSPSLLYVALKT
ncbi:MAG TPA: class I SAM-dependent methyltransferase [Bryobacteraceae bacterium]|jgi:ubiquinone/menaquinone biosynthesis C-methylase UbiE|nr:class I SAM-dependent methyltransferase [Bryobacteraceae bacterium]